MVTNAAIQSVLNGCSSSASQQLAESNLADEALIGFEEIETRKIAAIDPADLLKNSVLHLAFILLDSIKVQLDRAAFLVMMLNGSNLLANDRRNPELLLELATQSRSFFFAGLNLAAGKFPFQGHRLILRTLANQQLLFPNDQGRHYLLQIPAPWRHSRTTVRNLHCASLKIVMSQFRTAKAGSAHALQRRKG